MAGHQFRRADVDLIFLYVTTYALSPTVLPVVRRAKVPVIVLNLAPGGRHRLRVVQRPRRPHEDDRRVAGLSARPARCRRSPTCSTARASRSIRSPACWTTIPQAWDEIADWIDAARVAYVMEHNRLGVMGHYYGGMLDIYSDLTQQCAGFGGHVEIVEVDELAALRARGHAGPDRTTAWRHFREVFDVQRDCPADELERAARTSVALDRLVDGHDLGSLAYYYMGIGNPANEDAISSIILGNSPAHRPRHARGRRDGDQERPGHEDPRHLRRRRLVHRVLRDGLQGRRGAHGPRRARPHRASPRARPRCARSRSITARSAAASRSRCP